MAASAESAGQDGDTVVGTRTLRAGEAVALSSLSAGRRSPSELDVRVVAHGVAPDLVAFQLGPDGRVRTDQDLVFFNQPTAPGGAVSVDTAAASARIDTHHVEEQVARVLVGCAGGVLDTGRASTLRIDISDPRQGVLATATIEVPADHRAENLLEVYRWGTGWRLRVLADGYAHGLEAMVRDHGVQVEEQRTAAVPPPPPTPSSWPAPPSTPSWPAPPVVPPTRVVPPVRSKKRRHVKAFIGAGVAALVVVVLGAALAGGSDKPSPHAAAVVSTASTSAAPTPSLTTLAPATAAVVPVAATVQAELAQLAVKGRAPMTGYDRTQFGQEWADVDRNGCDTRNDILRRDVSGAVIDPSTHGCVVLSGEVVDPYSGTTIPFSRGATTSGDVQIDHIVALGDAWQTGAQQLDATKRQQFANDPANLLAVDGPLNAQKGDGDAATWLPPAKAFRCTYVSMQVQVKREYGLWVTTAERDAIARVLQTCPGATTPPTPTVAAPSTSVAPPPATTSAPPPPPATSAPPIAVVYANCTEARAAGVTPIYRGQPGYSSKLDRDGDGIACE